MEGTIIFNFYIKTALSLLLFVYLFGFGWAPDGIEPYKIIDTICIILIIPRLFLSRIIKFNLFIVAEIIILYTVVLIDQSINYINTGAGKNFMLAILLMVISIFALDCYQLYKGYFQHKYSNNVT